MPPVEMTTNLASYGNLLLKSSMHSLHFLKKSILHRHKLTQNDMTDVYFGMQFTTLIESQKFNKERDQIKKIDT